MRVALISVQQPGDGDGQPRGLLAIAGRSVAMLQLDLALRLGCQRIVCLAEGLHERVLPLLHRAEQAGATFHALNGPRALSGLVKAADELFIFAEAVVPDPLAVGETIGERQGILALPADAAVDAGFERIDRDRAWAGAARLPGYAVERLADMPGDFEPVSSLLRAGLQAGVRVMPLSKQQLAEGRWACLRGPADARTFEEGWVQRRVAPATLVALGNALADRVALRLAPGVLPSRGRRILPFLVGAMCLGGAVVAGWAGLPVPAFAAGAVGALLLRGGATLSAIARDERPAGRLVRLSRGVPGVAIDAAILAIVALLAAPGAMAGSLFAAAALLAALRIGQKSELPQVPALCADRILLCVVLAAGAGAGALVPTIQVAALAVLALVLFSSRR